MKKKAQTGDIVAKIIMLLTGAACGIFIIFSMNIFSTLAKSPAAFLLVFAEAMLVMYIASYLQTIFHESGHLIFGLLTGYKFISFRIGHFMFIREKGRLKVKLYNVVGTAGQCLMMPPQWSENMPYRLYNLGGCIMNLVTAAIALIAYFAAGTEGFFALCMAMLALMGFSMALTNGIPLRVGGISNDGMNAALLGKHKNTLRAFWLQLYVNGLLAKGERYRNMPFEWFRLPKGDELSDPICCTMGVMLFNYYFDLHEFTEAERTVDYMLQNAEGLLEVERNELLCELLFLRVLRGAPKEEVDPILTHKLDKYIKATASYVSRRRLAYAYQLLYLKNITTAQKCLEVFERTASTYPYSAETENEREIIEIIKQKATVSGE